MNRRGLSSPGRIIGWRLDRRQREMLLARFPPRYARVVADHVTLQSRAAEHPLPAPVTARIVGRVDDGRGVEAMVVEIDGSTDRPDGRVFHLTWSLGAGRKAVESNDAIAAGGWSPMDPVPLQVVPADISKGATS
jgi:hypothetical protein